MRGNTEKIELYRKEVHMSSIGSTYTVWVRAEQDEHNAVLGAKLRGWLHTYGLTAVDFRRWTSNPLRIERLTAEATESLYDAFAGVLEAEDKRNGKDVDK